jgi:hypothetical protein
MSTYGMSVAAQAQDTTTTTGTGAITLANAVPTGAVAGSTTFAAALAPTGVYPVPNVFFAIIDGSGNIELAIGTLTSATNLTRDFCLFSGTAGAVTSNNPTYVPAFVEAGSGGPLAFAAGTKNVYSNTQLIAATTPYWQKLPNLTNGSDGGITNDIMSGTFTATLNAGSATATGTVRYKVSSDGQLQLQLPALTATAVGTTLTITGVPATISNVTASPVPGFVVGTAAGGITVPGLFSLAPGATPTSTGTITLSQYAVVATGFTATFTTGVTNGIPAQTVTFAAF